MLHNIVRVLTIISETGTGICAVSFLPSDYKDAGVYVGNFNAASRVFVFIIFFSLTVIPYNLGKGIEKKLGKSPAKLSSPLRRQTKVHAHYAHYPVPNKTGDIEDAKSDRRMSTFIRPGRGSVLFRVSLETRCPRKKMQSICILNISFKCPGRIDLPR